MCIGLILSVDSNFFAFFTFSLKFRDPGICLVQPDGIVVDESTALHYVPSKDPIGKI